MFRTPKFPVIIILLLLCNTLLFAQHHHRKAHITGSITDPDGRPIEMTLVWLIDTANVVMAQDLTDSLGHFLITCVNKEVMLSVSCLGYLPYTSEPFNASKEKAFPTIVLSPKSESVGNVVVVGRKKQVVEQKNGRLVFNVENSMNSEGYNALEILRLTPGVDVGEDGSLSLYGRKNILVMLNGKPTYMDASEVTDILKSTPSSNIKSIEVMSNTPAQYDAAGSGGVLNIVMKKGRGDGFNMNINVGASYWYHMRQNAQLSFNYKKNKLNVYGNYGHNLGYVDLMYGSDRKQAGKLFSSDSFDTDKRNTANGTIGADYQINDRNTIGIQGNGNFVFGPGEINTTTDVFDAYENGNLLYTIKSLSDYYHQIANRYNFNANYRYEVEDVRQFTLDFDYGLFRGDSRNNQPNSYYSPSQVLDSTHNYRSTGIRNIDLFAITAKYREKVWRGSLIGGAKFSNAASKNDYNLFYVTDETEILDKKASNNFLYTESILAAYMLYDVNFNDKWSANAGLRLEYTHSNGDLRPVPGSGIDNSSVKRNYTDLFPSVAVTFKPDENNTVSLSYGKRIDRPIYSNLNPIEQPLDGLSSWKGNPFLEPQKTHRISMQYQYKKTSIELSYSKTNNHFTQMTEALGPDKLVMMPQNVGSQEYVGLSVSQSLRFFDAWDISLSGNLFHMYNHLAYDKTRSYNLRRWSGNASIQTSFPLVWGIRAEIIGKYVSPHLGGSTEIEGSDMILNAAIQNKFLRNRAMVSLAITDIFWDESWDNYNRTYSFESENYGRMETRQVKLNFSFSFGGGKSSETKQSKVESELDRF